MSDYARAFADHVGAAAVNGAPVPPATLGAIWRADWERAGLDLERGSSAVREAPIQELEQALARETGLGFEDFAERATGRRRAADFFDRDGRAAVLTAVAGALPEDQKKRLPFLDARAEGERRARKIEADAEFARAGSGLSGLAVGFLASAARSVTDPINLAATIATLPMGGAAGMTALRFAGRELVANAASQAVQEPFVQDNRRALGLDHGLIDAASNIAFAGVAGAALHPVVYFRAAASRLAERRAASAAAGTPEAPGAFAPEDFAAAATHAEARAYVDAQAPTPTALPAHLDAVDRAAERMEAGRAVPVETLDLPASRSASADALAELPQWEPPPGGLAVRSGADDVPEGLFQATLRAPEDAPLAPVREKKARLPDGPGLSISQFIARNGGLDLNADHIGQDWHTHFVPGGGPLARKSGRSMDDWRDRLAIAGYIPYDGDGTVSRDVRAELYDLIRRDLSGDRIYTPEGQGRAAARAAMQDADAHYRALDVEVERIAEAHREFGIDLDRSDRRTLYEAAQLLMDGAEADPVAALERAAILRESMDDALPGRVKTVYGDIPFGDSDALQRGSAPADGGGTPAGGRGGDAGSQARSGRTGASVRGAGDGGREAGAARGADAGQALDPADAARRAEAAGRRAEAEATIAQYGDRLALEGPDGRPVPAAEFLARLDREKIGADELMKCLGGAS